MGFFMDQWWNPC